MSDNNNENNEEIEKTQIVPEASELESLQAELEKYKKDYLYLLAEFDNFKKNVIKERSELVKYSSSRIFTDLLDILDNFDRALEVELTPENAKNYQAGIELTATELKSLLERFGVSAVESKGLPFNPSMHEALSSEPTTEVSEGHVLRVFKKAYKLHDRLLRPAQVVVAKLPDKTP
ncbi:MAG: nucleotide exchange factor GrpE [Bdellovibrionales bacterium]